MKKFGFSLVLSALIIAVSPASAMVVDITLLNEDFIRGKGSPVIETRTFTGFAAPATINIYNGAQNDNERGERVSSSVINVNGVDAFGTADFNQNVTILTGQVNLNEGDNTISVELRGKPGGKIRVEIVQATDQSFSAPSSPDKIINDQGAVYPINEIIINLTDEASNEDAQEIASSIGGSIVGFVPSIKLLQVKVPVFSKEELQILADELSNNNNPLVEGVFFNYLPALLDEDYNNDLEHRKSVNETSVAAYEKIELFKAYNYLIDKNPPFNDVKIGIIDNGLYLDHVEFENVEINCGNDTPTPADGHGTAVTGIIGANNIAGKDETPADSQMNGILAGVPDPTSKNGSKIKYTIEFRQVSFSSDPEKALDTAHAIISAIYELAIKGVQVINMSLGMTKRSLLSMSSLEVILGGIIDHDFYEVSAAFYETAYRHSNIIFVAAAGNAGIDASNHVPACVEADNFITVGATDLNDQRGVWPVPWYKFWKKSESNWGEVVDIAAPGEHIWAPVSKKDSGEYYSDYDEFSMTSGAAPMVTGVVGLMLAINKDLKPSDIRDILRKTGYDISEITDEPLGGKRLDAYKAVKRVVDDLQGGTIGEQGNGDCWNTSISADGRFVAFDSSADNLVTDDSNEMSDVFVYDRQTGETTRVSVSSDGVQSEDGCYNPSISTDGRFVAFVSSADNLVSDDSNEMRDVFVHDRQTGETTRVSVSSDEVQSEDGCYNPSISTDGRFVAFDSSADNLVSDDSFRRWNVFVHDRQAGETISIGMGVQDYSTNTDPSISADGRFVAFVGEPNDLNGNKGIYVYDRQTGETTLVTIYSAGLQRNVYYGNPSISADGRFVAFDSADHNLVPDDSVNGAFVHDRQTGETRFVGVQGMRYGGTYDGNPSISANGRLVASISYNLPGVYDPRDVFVHDRQTGETSQVSVSSTGVPSNGQVESYSISADGRFVAFVSSANNLVSDDSNEMRDVFVHDLETGETTLVSVSSAGE